MRWFILIFILVYSFFGLEIGYTRNSPLWTHFTYMFQHSGIIHLILNSIMFIAMANALRKFVKKWVLIISIIPISFASSFLSMYEIPTVGASGMVYAMIGIFISISVLADNIIVNKKIYMLLICSIGLSLLISYLKGNSNFWLHIFCLLFGIAAGIMIEIIKEIQHSQ